jgi:hypothetical protein
VSNLRFCRGPPSGNRCHARAPARRPESRRLSLEYLEDRSLLSTIPLTVNTITDDPAGLVSGQTTLRDAITQADADMGNQCILNLAASTVGWKARSFTTPKPPIARLWSNFDQRTRYTPFRSHEPNERT